EYLLEQRRARTRQPENKDRFAACGAVTGALAKKLACAHLLLACGVLFHQLRAVATRGALERIAALVVVPRLLVLAAVLVRLAERQAPRRSRGYRPHGRRALRSPSHARSGNRCSSDRASAVGRAARWLPRACGGRGARRRSRGAIRCNPAPFRAPPPAGSRRRRAPRARRRCARADAWPRRDCHGAAGTRESA